MDTYKEYFTNLDFKIFSVLCAKAGEKLSQRDIAKELDVSPTAVSNSVKRLVEKQLAQLEKVKTINFISFNRENYKAIELKSLENLKSLYAIELKEYLEEKLAGSTIILFGSFAKGEDTIRSDIDIAVIGRKEKILHLESFEQKLLRTINVNFYDSWAKIHKHLKNNILNGIVLSGSVSV